jgi:hypothetical protein
MADRGKPPGTAVSLVVEDGWTSRVDAIRNPHKLARLDEEGTLGR